MFLQEQPTNNLPDKYQIGSIVWAICLGALALFFTTAVMLPSTKRAHLDFQRLDPAAGGTTAAPATRP